MNFSLQEILIFMFNKFHDLAIYSISLKRDEDFLPLNRMIYQTPHYRRNIFLILQSFCYVCSRVNDAKSFAYYLPLKCIISTENDILILGSQSCLFIYFVFLKLIRSKIALHMGREDK